MLVWTLNIEPWILNIEHWTLNLEYWTLNIEHWTLNFWTLNIEHWTMNFWTLNIELLNIELLNFWTLNIELLNITVYNIYSSSPFRPLIYLTCILTGSSRRITGNQCDNDVIWPSWSSAVRLVARSVVLLSVTFVSILEHCVRTVAMYFYDII